MTDIFNSNTNNFIEVIKSFLSSDNTIVKYEGTDYLLVNIFYKMFEKIMQTNRMLNEAQKYLELLLLSMYQPPYTHPNYDYVQVYGHTQAYLSLGVELFKNILRENNIETTADFLQIYSNKLFRASCSYIFHLLHEIVYLLYTNVFNDTITPREKKTTIKSKSCGYLVEVILSLYNETSIVCNTPRGPDIIDIGENYPATLKMFEVKTTLSGEYGCSNYLSGSGNKYNCVNIKSIKNNGDSSDISFILNTYNDTNIYDFTTINLNNTFVDSIVNNINILNDFIKINIINRFNKPYLNINHLTFFSILDLIHSVCHNWKDRLNIDESYNPVPSGFIFTNIKPILSKKPSNKEINIIQHSLINLNNIFIKTLSNISVDTVNGNIDEELATITQILAETKEQYNIDLVEEKTTITDLLDRNISELSKIRLELDKLRDTDYIQKIELGNKIGDLKILSSTISLRLELFNKIIENKQREINELFAEQQRLTQIIAERPVSTDRSVLTEKPKDTATEQTKSEFNQAKKQYKKILPLINKELDKINEFIEKGDSKGAESALEQISSLFPQLKEQIDIMDEFKKFKEFEPIILEADRRKTEIETKISSFSKTLDALKASRPKPTTVAPQEPELPDFSAERAKIEDKKRAIREADSLLKTKKIDDRRADQNETTKVIDRTVIQLALYHRKYKEDEQKLLNLYKEFEPIKNELIRTPHPDLDRDPSALLNEINKIKNPSELLRYFHYINNFKLFNNSNYKYSLQNSYVYLLRCIFMFNIINNIFNKSFGEYRKNIQSIIDNHVINKIITNYPDTTDIHRFLKYCKSDLIESFNYNIINNQKAFELIKKGLDSINNLLVNLSKNLYSCIFISIYYKDKKDTSYLLNKFNFFYTEDVAYNPAVMLFTKFQTTICDCILTTMTINEILFHLLDNGPNILKEELLFDRFIRNNPWLIDFICSEVFFVNHKITNINFTTLINDYYIGDYKQLLINSIPTYNKNIEYNLYSVFIKNHITNTFFPPVDIYPQELSPDENSDIIPKDFVGNAKVRIYQNEPIKWIKKLENKLSPSSIKLFSKIFENKSNVYNIISLYYDFDNFMNSLFEMFQISNVNEEKITPILVKILYSEEKLDNSKLLDLFHRLFYDYLLNVISVEDTSVMLYCKYSAIIIYFFIFIKNIDKSKIIFDKTNYSSLFNIACLILGFINTESSLNLLKFYKKHNTNEIYIKIMTNNLILLFNINKFELTPDEMATIDKTQLDELTKLKDTTKHATQIINLIYINKYIQSYNYVTKNTLINILELFDIPEYSSFFNNKFNIYINTPDYDYIRINYKPYLTIIQHKLIPLSQQMPFLNDSIYEFILNHFKGSITTDKETPYYRILKTIFSYVLFTLIFDAKKHYLEDYARILITIEYLTNLITKPKSIFTNNTLSIRSLMYCSSFNIMKTIEHYNLYKKLYEKTPYIANKLLYTVLPEILYGEGQKDAASQDEKYIEKITDRDQLSEYVKFAKEFKTFAEDVRKSKDTTLINLETNPSSLLE